MTHERVVAQPLESGQSPSAAEKLARVLADFARTMLTDFPIQAILDELVRRIVDVLPITAAGVTVMSLGSAPRYFAGSDDSARQFEELQTRLGEGPGVWAHRQGEAVCIPELRAELRFLRFTQEAIDLGLAAIFTFPLRHGNQQIGALDLYRNTTGPLSESAMEDAQTLADVASSYLINAQARDDMQTSSDDSRQAALHDALTGLPNRILMIDRLEHAFLRSRRTGSKSAALFVDLDRLKAVNDFYGHAVGDELLAAVAQRLSQMIRAGDTAARMSGDEFVILCEDLDSPAAAAAIGARLIATISQPFELNSVVLSITASMGISYADHGDHTPEQMLQEADSAMYQAKRDGGNRLQIFDSTLQETLDIQMSLERDLQGVLQRGELHNEYQPIVAGRDGRILGFEALIRWQHPQRGPVPPTTLIPLAEQSGNIAPLGLWVLNQALLDRHRWSNGQFSESPVMSVNVSPHQLMASGFAETVSSVLAATGTDPRKLTLEITESVFIQDAERALKGLNDLRDVGVAIALDDFGTGYSSLSYLSRFPMDIIKIDRSFVSRLADSGSSMAIVRAVVQLAHDMKMTVVAEGVENRRQLEVVTALGCDAWQGFYFARPMTATNADKLMHRHSSRSARLGPIPAMRTYPLAATLDTLAKQPTALDRSAAIGPIADALQ